jgi:hypothetical protein
LTVTSNPGVPALSPEQRRRLAVDLFNHTWTLLDLDERTAEQDDEMIHAAHASRHHWAAVGTGVNLARGEWQISRVYTLLGRPESAIWHAKRCLEHCEANGIGDWDLAYAYEALARAHALADDGEADHWKAKAREAGDVIASPGEREHFDEDYATL